MSQKSNTATDGAPILESAEPPKQMLPGVPRRRPVRKAEPDPPPVLIPDIRKPGQLKQLARTKKSNEWEIQQRRRDVRRLRMRGMSYNEIAEELHISLFIVRRDLEAVQKEACARVDAVEQKEFVGSMLIAFDDIVQHAWDEFYKTVAGSKSRMQALDIIRTTTNDKLKVATEVGLIQRAATEVKHTHQALPWDDSTKQAAINALIQSRLTPQYLLPTPDPEHSPGKNIDVTPIPPPAKTAAPVQDAIVVEEVSETEEVIVPESIHPDMRDRAAEAIRKLVGLGMSVAQATQVIAEGSALAEASAKDITKKVLNKPKA